MTTKQHILAFLAAAGLTIAAHAADETARVTPGHSTTDAPGAFPDLRVPDGLGVNIHYFSGLTTNDLDQMQAAGFRFIREDFAWSRVEKQKGVYDFQPYDDLTRELTRRGLRAVHPGLRQQALRAVRHERADGTGPPGVRSLRRRGRRALSRPGHRLGTVERARRALVSFSIWYDWRNDGSDPQNMEHNFGTVTFDRQPKPAYRAMQKLTEALGGMHFVKRLDRRRTNGGCCSPTGIATSSPRGRPPSPGARESSLIKKSNSRKSRNISRCRRVWRGSLWKMTMNIERNLAVNPAAHEYGSDAEAAKWMIRHALSLLCLALAGSAAAQSPTILRIILAALLLAPLAALGAAEFHVATNGSDADPGTEVRPLATIQAGVNKLQPGDTLIVRGGVYRETVTFPAQRHGGQAQSRSRCIAWREGRITGCEPVTGWTLHDAAKKIWKAPMPWTLGQGRNQVFCDGKVVIEARFPNQPAPGLELPVAGLDPMWPTYGEFSIPDRKQHRRIVSKLLEGQPDDYWKGAMYCGFHFEGWTPQAGIVTSSQAGTDGGADLLGLVAPRTRSPAGRTPGITPSRADAACWSGT